LVSDWFGFGFTALNYWIVLFSLATNCFLRKFFFAETQLNPINATLSIVSGLYDCTFIIVVNWLSFGFFPWLIFLLTFQTELLVVFQRSAWRFVAVRLPAPILHTQSLFSN